MSLRSSVISGNFVADCRLSFRYLVVLYSGLFIGSYYLIFLCILYTWFTSNLRDYRVLFVQFIMPLNSCHPGTERVSCEPIYGPIGPFTAPL